MGYTTNIYQPSGTPPQGSAPIDPANAYAQNQQQYQNILNGYQGQQNAMAGQGNYLQNQYQAVQDRALGQLDNTQAANVNQLNNQFATNLAGDQMNAYAKGLGNTTNIQGIQNADQMVYNQGLTGVLSNYGQAKAGVVQQTGLASLGALGQVYGAQQQLAGQQLGGQQNVLQSGLQNQYGLTGAQQNFGINSALGVQNGQTTADAAARGYAYQQAAAQQNFGYQQASANADLDRQNQYDFSGGGYAGG